VALTARGRAAERTAPTGATAANDQGEDADRLRWLIRRIAADDHDAFAELFHRISGPMSRRLLGHVSDPLQVAGVVAGTFVEVWWLAGGHVDPDTDVIAWIDQIVRRRVQDRRPSVAGPADPSEATEDVLRRFRTLRVEAELAELNKLIH
jgi:DNA-directed RNA polymerase specialized sigma24 family protein